MKAIMVPFVLLVILVTGVVVYSGCDSRPENEIRAEIKAERLSQSSGNTQGTKIGNIISNPFYTPGDMWYYYDSVHDVSIWVVAMSGGVSMAVLPGEQVKNPSR